MLVTFCIVALNAQKTLPRLLEQLFNQTYSRADTEVIMVDGNSNDSTKSLMVDFKRNYESLYNRIEVFDNPGRTLPCGWNVALKEYKGDVILRVDAHSCLPTDFIEKNVTVINEGHDIVGGKIESISGKVSAWSEVVNSAENSMFGGSVAKFRRADKACVVDTVGFAMYRRRVFEKVGFYNEKLTRTEDNEMHYRMRNSGFEFFYDPRISSKRETRSSFLKLLKQKFLNGYWIGITAKICPRCFSVYHYVPFLFVLGIIATTVLALIGFWQFAAVMWALYGLFTVVMTVLSFIGAKKKSILFVFLPFMFLVLHICYGAGTLLGLFAKS